MNKIQIRNLDLSSEFSDAPALDASLLRELSDSEAQAVVGGMNDTQAHWLSSVGLNASNGGAISVYKHQASHSFQDF